MKKVYLIAVVFALLAMFATFMFANQLDKKSSIKDANMVEVIVATEDIPSNTLITAEMFEEDTAKFKTVSVVSDTADQLAIKKQEDLIDKVTVDPIYTGETINENRVVGMDDDSVGLSYKLEKGKVAYSFSAGSVNGVDGYISVGDTVDVLVYEKDDSGKTVPRVAYKDLKILRVSNASADASASASGSAIRDYGTLTVEVTEKQALQLYTIENDYSFKLVLKPRK